VLDALFNPHGFALAMLLKRAKNVPFVLYCPTYLLPSDTWSRALSGSWAAQQSMFTSIPSDHRDVFDATKFWNRLTNVVENSISVVGMHVIGEPKLLSDF
jgi:hypothetical protein